MPSSVGPNTFGEENLVFGYDLGDVSNSYKGEPTSNTAVTNNFYTYWNNSGTASWSNNDSTVTRLVPDLPVMSMYKLTDGNSHLGFGYSSQVTTSTEYTYSTYIWIPSSNSATMPGSVPYFRPQPANYGAVTLSYNGSTNWGTWPRDRWIRISGTATTQATNVTSAYISCYLDTAGDKVFFTAPQMEQKSHATPFINGTRSATQGLLDFTGNSTIDLTNVSFDSNAQMTFDGTDDEINTGITTQLTDFSCEVVFKNNNSQAWGRLVDKSYTDGFFISAYFATSGIGYVGAGIIEPNPPHGQALQYDTNKYNYFVVTRSGTTHTIYLNGSANSLSKTGSSSALGTAEMAIGAWYDTYGSQRFTGEIPVVKLYNRALTADEVQRNFNAIKGRFNI
jgi:hypothetical protein